MNNNFARQYIHITGIVQGVGFRPFVYQLALAHQLVGQVINDSEGVKIDVQGNITHLQQFIASLTENAPPLSRIDQLTVCERLLWLDDERPHVFSIEQSQHLDNTTVCISADQGLCDACKQDLTDSNSRYFQYPFTNCTHCGPRYSIIKALPYDRSSTSMQAFELCPECQAAYEDPLDRRYHAQPISCEHCGPWVEFIDYTKVSDAAGSVIKQQAIEQIAQRLKSGAVVAIKGLGGFHLACDATNMAAVATLRDLKHRQRKPLAVMVANEGVAKQLVNGCELEWQTLQSQPRPIVLMHKRQSMTSILANNVAPNAAYLGVMLPYTPLHYLLFTALAKIDASAVLVMTSANLSGMPIATNINEINAQFSTTIDSALDHNRSIVHACDDSVVHYAGGKIRTLRMARGYGPYSQFETSHSNEHALLALGAEQKATIALALPQQWVISPYIGDLNDIDTEHRYQQTITELLALYQVSPQTIVCDFHPHYHSSVYAQQLVEQRSETTLLQVQHHHAHILAVMAEFNLTQPVIGFAFDGTGWGEDQSVWGGEVLFVTPTEQQRLCHLRTFRLIGGERAIKEPARLLFAMLLECYDLNDIKAMQLKAFSQWDDRYFNNLYQLWQSGSRSPYTSSMGRLIDAWACLLGVVTHVDFEGECGLLLEHYAYQDRSHIPLSFTLTNDGVIDWQPLLTHVLPLMSVGSQDEQQLWINSLSHSFFVAIAKLIDSLATHYPNHPIVLGGGVFQNRVLLDEIDAQGLFSRHEIYCGEHLPTNDGAIAAGQLWYARHHNNKNKHIKKPEERY